MERFIFTECGDGTYSVKIYGDGTAVTSAVAVPSEYNGRPVARLTFGEMLDANFQRLTIPGTVREIALYDDLYEELSFANMNNIFTDELVIDESNPVYRTDGKALFSRDGKILYRLLPRYIEEYDVPEGTEIIEREAFKRLEHLARLSLPEGLREIRELAFNGCGALGELHIPSTVVKGRWQKPGRGLICFTGYDVAPENPSFRSENGVVYSKDMTELFGAPNVMREKLTVPPGVLRIEDYAFSDRSGIRGAELPESCTAIGLSFIRCTGLESINLEHVRTMSTFAFSGCTALRSVELHCGKVPLRAFDGCAGLIRARLDCAEIDREAFADCRELTSLTFSEKTESIGDGAFESCTALRCLTLPEGLVTIGERAFLRAPLKCVAIPKTVKYIGDGAFGSAEKVMVYDTLKMRRNFMSNVNSVFSPDRELIVKSAADDRALYGIWLGCKSEEAERFNKIMSRCFKAGGFDFDLADSSFGGISDVLTKAYYAYYRLTSPNPPSRRYAEEFALYLRTEGLTIAMNCIIGNWSGLIIRLADYILTMYNLTPIVELTVKRGMTELTAFLLDYRRRFGAPDDLRLD